MVIYLEEERTYLPKCIDKLYIYLPEKCPQCSSSKFSIDNINNIMSLIRFFCNNYKCKYRWSNLRKYSFLKLYAKFPESVIIKIIYGLLI